MKNRFRILEEITTVNGQEKSAFFCETRFLWGWSNVFYEEDLDGDYVGRVGFSTKQEALCALRERYGVPKIKTKTHEVTL